MLKLIIIRLFAIVVAISSVTLVSAPTHATPNYPLCQQQASNMYQWCSTLDRWSFGLLTGNCFNELVGRYKECQRKQSLAQMEYQQQMETYLEKIY